MKLFKFGATALSFGVMLSLFVLVGCGGGTATTPPTDKKDEVTPPTGGGPKTAMKAGKAVIKGKVTFDGDMPDIEKLNAELLAQIKDKGAADVGQCLSDKCGTDKDQQTWIIGKDKGLKNVVVFLVPEQGTYFACSKDDEGVKKVLDKALEVHQPYCAFHPHAAVLFSEYRDDKDKKQKTGSTLVVHNDTDKAPGGKTGGIGHNLKWPGDNVLIAPGAKKEISDLSVNNKTPVPLQCSIHTWMNSNIWVLDHPYFAVTDENGEFEIKNAPVGKVKITVWHEAVTGLPKAESIVLKDGENKLDYKAKK
jgi:hypothetical protein